MAVKFKCRYCNKDISNFDCSCERKERNQDMWNKDCHKINKGGI